MNNQQTRQRRQFDHQRRQNRERIQVRLVLSAAGLLAVGLAIVAWDALGQPRAAGAANASHVETGTDATTVAQAAAEPRRPVVDGDAQPLGTTSNQVAGYTAITSPTSGFGPVTDPVQLLADPTRTEFDRDPIRPVERISVAPVQPLLDSAPNAFSSGSDDLLGASFGSTDLARPPAGLR